MPEMEVRVLPVAARSAVRQGELRRPSPPELSTFAKNEELEALPCAAAQNCAAAHRLQQKQQEQQQQEQQQHKQQHKQQQHHRQQQMQQLISSAASSQFQYMSVPARARHFF